MSEASPSRPVAAARRLLPLGLGLLLVGCAATDRAAGPATPATGTTPTTPTTPTTLPAAPAEPEPLFAILESRSPGPPLRGEDVYPVRPGRWRLEVVEAEAGHATTGDQRVHLAAATERFGAATELVEGDERTEYRALVDDGSVVVPAVIDHRQRALTLFEPPLVVVGPALVGGVEQRTETAMTVVDARNTSRVRERGRAIRTIEYVGDDRVRCPLGEVVAGRVAVRFVADLRLADAETTSTLWVVPGVGVVAQEHEEKVVVLGFPARRSFVRLVTVE